MGANLLGHVITMAEYKEEESENKKRIGQLIRDARKESGMSTYKLAEETLVDKNGDFVHMHHATITKIEHGNYAPNIDTLWSILTPLGYRLTIEKIPEKTEEDIFQEDAEKLAEIKERFEKQYGKVE